MYIYGIGNAAGGLKICVIMEDRYVLGYSAGRSVDRIMKQAKDAANAQLEIYGLEPVTECVKSRLTPSFFSSLSCECLQWKSYRTAAQLMEILDDYIDYYNRDRYHSSLKYATPFEAWRKEHGFTEP